MPTAELTRIRPAAGGLARHPRAHQAARNEPGGVHRPVRLLVAPVQLPLVLGFTAILCIALAAGSCGALNQWYEADIDAKMRRTANRPLPAGRMDRQAALHFGVGLGFFRCC